MSGSESIDFSLENIFSSWHKFKIGKSKTKEFHDFQYDLESNLFDLHNDLNSETYKHGVYWSFEVKDNKKRLITVACIKDRVVHRLLYDYLVEIFDKTFIYDVWSCRKGKGLHSAINRSREFALKNQSGYFWRADVSKFFNSVNTNILYDLVARKVKCKNALWLLKTVLISFNQNGIPIGNLSSQILANIYLNELDRYVKHKLKCKYYLRYGDDFIVFDTDKNNLVGIHKNVSQFLKLKLKIQLGPVGGIFRVNQGITFLGVVVKPYDLRLNTRNHKRIFDKVNLVNLPSYIGVLKMFNRLGLWHTLIDKFTVDCEL